MTSGWNGNYGPGFDPNQHPQNPGYLNPQATQGPRVSITKHILISALVGFVVVGFFGFLAFMLSSPSNKECGYTSGGWNGSYESCREIPLTGEETFFGAVVLGMMAAVAGAVAGTIAGIVIYSVRNSNLQKSRAQAQIQYSQGNVPPQSQYPQGYQNPVPPQSFSPETNSPYMPPGDGTNQS